MSRRPDRPDDPALAATVARPEVEAAVDRTVTAVPVGGATPAGQRRAAAAGVADDPAGRPLRQVDRDDYRVDDEIARGGMGRVLRARDLRHGRGVAVKEMLDGGGGELAMRFEREALITARLQHPGIVPVYEAGRWPDGTRFYSMKLVEGRPLDDLAAAAADPAARLALVPNLLAVCEALAYAHSEGVIHRDLKPSNVVVGGFGETIVIDWGLARDLAAGDDPDPPGGDGGAGERPAAASGSGPALTSAGSVLGTPGYMAPEQAVGEPADARSDVYALGAMLYRVLAGAPPYDGRSAEQVLAQVRAGPPPPLAERAPGLPVDLLAIVAVAMAREPEDRYPDARALADELRRFQTGQLVGAHRYTAGQLLRRWLRRHRAAVAVAGVALLAVAGISGYAIHRVIAARDAAERARDDEEAQRRAAVAQKDEAEELMAFMVTDLGQSLEQLQRLDLLEEIARKLADYDRRVGTDSHDPRTLERRWRQLILVGDVLLPKGDIDGAEAAYRDAGGIAAELGRLGGGAARTRMAAESDARLARVMVERGQHAAAARQFEAVVAVLSPLVAADPTDDAAAAALASALAELGGAHFVLGDLDAAQDAFQRCRDAAAARTKRNPAAVRQLGEAMVRLGDVQRQRGDLAGARATFEQMLDATEQFLARNPQDAEILFGQGYILLKLGITHNVAGDAEAAAAAYQRSEQAFTRLVAVSPSARNRFFLASAVANQADLTARRDRAGADAGYRRAIQILEEITATDPDYVEWQVALARDYLALADLNTSGAGVREARTLVDRAGYILDRLEKKHGPIPAIYGDLRADERAVRARLP